MTTAEASLRLARWHDATDRAWSLGRSHRQPVDSSAPDDWPLVGRERELCHLRSQLERAIAGHGGVVMISGEAGIGKTRLAEELTARAGAQGARVVWARCWEGEGSPVYWPWAQVLGELLSEAAGGETLPADLLQEVAQIVPELSSGAASTGAVGADGGDAGAGRFRLFQAVAAVLAGAARSQPLVVVLDDMHWAGPPSLALLHFLARGIRNTKLLIVATYRDVEIGPHHPLRSVFGGLVRDSTRVALVGLTETDVASLIEAAGGEWPSRALAAALHRHTDGNAFFVSEVVRLLVAGGLVVGGDGRAELDLAIPSTVREMIGGQLERLSTPSCRLLEKAAVVGREFDAGLLARVTSMPNEEVLSILHEAGAANVVFEDRDVPGRYCFTHVLVRESIYDELPPAERVATHRAVGRAIEEAAMGPPARYLAMLAHHFFQADPTSVDALVHSVRAGDHANACLAHEEAVRYYERAFQILESRGDHDHAQRCELFLALGDARSKAADVDGARAAFKSAAVEARFVKSPELLARAAIGYGGRFPGMACGTVNLVLVSLLEESLAEIGPAETPLRATLLARLSRALFYDTDQRRRLALSDEAMTIAKRLNDSAAQVAALNARYWALTGPHQSQSRLATAKEMTKLASASGDVEMALQGHNWALFVLAELGDMVGADQEIQQHLTLSRELNQPFYSWLSVQFQVMRALMCGRFSDVEILARDALDVGQAIASSMPVREIFLAQCLNLHLERGQQGEAQKLFRETRAGSDASASSALCLCHLGRLDEARDELVVAMQRDLHRSPRDAVWLVAAATLAEVAAWLGERSAGERIYRELRPYADYNAASTVMCKGSVSHFLGLLAAMAGRNDDADRHFENALDFNAAMGARPLVARTQYEYARTLASREDVEARVLAGALLSEARKSAEALGMAGVVRDCDELEKELAEARSDCVETAAIAPAGFNRFEQVGDVWDVQFGGMSVRVRDTKGMRYLRELLAHPGREFHVADLGGALGADGGNAGEVLDSRAKAEYQARVRDLEEALAEAEAKHDAGRIGLVSEELNFITHELASAYGLGGRGRRTGDTTERMRKAITNRIRAAVTGIGALHPRLGQHLSNSVKTGVYCAYVPETQTTWVL